MGGRKDGARKGQRALELDAVLRNQLKDGGESQQRTLREEGYDPIVFFGDDLEKARVGTQWTCGEVLRLNQGSSKDGEGNEDKEKINVMEPQVIGEQRAAM